MKRSNLAGVASETVKVCEAGQYQAPSGKQVFIFDDVKRAVEGTVIYSVESLPANPMHRSPVETSIEVANETTFQGLLRLAAHGGHIACLNFASARNPGGGFLGGAQAQEEALARASALYQCLVAA